MRHQPGPEREMKEILPAAAIGMVAGTIDVVPMIKMRLDKYSIASAFVFYCMMSFVVLNRELFGMPWWLKGAVFTLALASPIMILVAKTEKKSVPIMAGTAVVPGTFIGAAGRFLMPWRGGGRKGPPLNRSAMKHLFSPHRF